MSNATVNRSNRGRLDAALRSVLPQTVNLRVGRGKGLIVELDLDGHRMTGAWLGEGSLRQVREIVDGDGDRPHVVAARRLLPGARDALSAAGIGWVDESGAAEIATSGIIVSRTGRPSKTAERSPHWTPAVLSVAEALLCRTGATVSAIQATTGLSAGSSVNALRILSELGLLTSSIARGPSSGRRVLDPDGLLDAYAVAASSLAPPLALRVGVTWQDVVEGVAGLGRRLDGAGISWAVTGAAGAAVVAPLLTNVTTADMYVDANTIAQLEAIARQMDLRPIDGGRLTLRPFPTRTANLLASSTHGVRVVPWPRLFVDLAGEGVRGEEAAEHLRETIRGS